MNETFCLSNSLLKSTVFKLNERNAKITFFFRQFCRTNCSHPKRNFPAKKQPSFQNIQTQYFFTDTTWTNETTYNNKIIIWTLKTLKTKLSNQLDTRFHEIPCKDIACEAVMFFTLIVVIVCTNLMNKKSNLVLVGFIGPIQGWWSFYMKNWCSCWNPEIIAWLMVSGRNGRSNIRYRYQQHCLLRIVPCNHFILRWLAMFISQKLIIIMFSLSFCLRAVTSFIFVHFFSFERKSVCNMCFVICWHLGTNRLICGFINVSS